LGSSTALLLALTALALAAVCLPSALLDRVTWRALLSWVLAAIALFIPAHPLATLVLMAIAMAALAPWGTRDRVAYFLMVVPAVPVYVAAPLPFPGINFLTVLTHYKLAVAVVLVPAIVACLGVAYRKGARVADISLAAFLVVTALLSLAAYNVTYGARFLVDQLLLIGIPFFVLSRVIRGERDLVALASALVVAAVLLAGITWVATARQFDFYRLLDPSPLAAEADIRGGFLRIAGTLNNHSLGFHLGVALLLLEFLKTRVKLSFWRLWLVRGFLAGALFFTGSRGAMVGTALAFSVCGLLLFRSMAVRIVLSASFLTVVAAAVLWLLSDASSRADPYGTFSYRQQLLETAIRFVIDNPLFGDIHYQTSGDFDHMVQGQGIIDITNLYLQVAVQYGLIGLTCFLGWVGPITLALMLRLRKWDGADALEQTVILTGALLLGWLAYVATTSDVGLTMHLGIVLLAIGRATTHYAARRAYRPRPELPRFPERHETVPSSATPA